MVAVDVEVGVHGTSGVVHRDVDVFTGDDAFGLVREIAKHVVCTGEGESFVSALCTGDGEAVEVSVVSCDFEVFGEVEGIAVCFVGGVTVHEDRSDAHVAVHPCGGNGVGEVIVELDGGHHDVFILRGGVNE